jgi:hypothetical protein
MSLLVLTCKYLTLYYRCNTYLPHRRPELKAVPGNAWLMATELSVIQSDRQCLYIGGHILLSVKKCESCELWILLSNLLCIVIQIRLFHKYYYLSSVLFYSDTVNQST